MARRDRNGERKPRSKRVPARHFQLGYYLIVTDTEATAKDAIAYLKANKFGRATFLPLKAVTGREEFRNEAVLSEHGVLGLASSLVNVEERYEGVARYLLGRIVVADNIDNALALARAAVRPQMQCDLRLPVVDYISVVGADVEVESAFDLSLYDCVAHSRPASRSLATCS